MAVCRPAWTATLVFGTFIAALSGFQLRRPFMRSLPGRSLFLAIPALLALSAAVLVRGDEQADLKALIARAIVAHGGEVTLSKLPALTWNETGTYYGNGNEFPYTATVAAHYPSRLKMDVQGVYVLAVDGENSWIDAGGNVRDIPPEILEEQKEILHSDWVATLVPLNDKSKEFKLETLGEVMVENKPAIGVRVSRKDHRAVSLYFDKATGLLAKVEYPVKSREQGGQVVSQEKIILEYGDAQGAKIPVKRVTKRDGKPYLDSKHAETKRLEKLDDSAFKRP
jgi:hypothetical protein